MGILAIHSYSPNAFTQDDLHLLQSITSHCSGALERLRAEEALRDREQEFRAIFELASIGMAQADPRTGRWLRVNARFCQITGYSTDEMLRLRVPEITHPQDRDRDWELFQSVIRGETPAYQAEKRYLRKDGTIAWVHVNMTVIRDAAGQPVRTTATIEDITDRKHAEDRLRSSLDEKTALLKEVHHRVKNNLQIVASLLNLQANRAQHREAVEGLLDSRNRVQSMGLLHEVLYSSGNLAQVDFAAYVARLCEKLLHSVGAISQRVRLVTQVAPVGLPLEQAVPCGLIINELVFNALKHGFPDERAGTITVEMRLTEKRKVLLRVSDDGIGLPAGLDSSSSSTLGLRLIASLIGQLRGQWEIESDCPVGAAFQIIFPAQPEGSGECVA